MPDAVGKDGRGEGVGSSQQPPGLFGEPPAWLLKIPPGVHKTIVTLAAIGFIISLGFIVVPTIFTSETAAPVQAVEAPPPPPEDPPPFGADPQAWWFATRIGPPLVLLMIFLASLPGAYKEYLQGKIDVATLKLGKAQVDQQKRWADLEHPLFIHSEAYAAAEAAKTRVFELEAKLRIELDNKYADAHKRLDLERQLAVSTHRLWMRLTSTNMRREPMEMSAQVEFFLGFVEALKFLGPVSQLTSEITALVPPREQQFTREAQNPFDDFFSRPFVRHTG